MYVEEGVYYLCSENKNADQLCSYCTADLDLCFPISKYPHDAIKIMEPDSKGLFHGYKDRHLSRLVGKPTMWFPNRSDTNLLVQAQKRARSLKFRIYVEEELYYPSSKNNDTDQLRSYCEADLCLCFRLCRLLVFPCGGSHGYYDRHLLNWCRD